MTTYINQNLSNKEYHADSSSFSSSNLKDALEDIELLYKNKILKAEKEESANQDAFDTGTYFHTRVLEPELLDKECAVWPSGVRKGKVWEEFKSQNKGKAIVTETQKESAEAIAKLVFDSPQAMNILKKGKPEISVFVGLVVDWEKKQIYTEDFSNVLTANGWRYIDFEEEQPVVSESAKKIQFKSRSDLSIVTESYGEILDLKSTTGNTKNAGKIKRKISELSYDLSAAFYLDLHSIAYGVPFKNFYWTFASKDIGNCKTYLASEDCIKVGRAKWKEAACLIAENMFKEWKFTDTIDLIEPESWQKLEWLKEENKK
jgi:hypothetical protein